MSFKWVSFFSQTGSDIVNVSNALHKGPNIIVTNRSNLDKCHDQIKVWEQKNFIIKGKTLLYLPNKPRETDYLNAFKQIDKQLGRNVLITLHGYLRILPASICNKYNVYNLHPGLITKFPELKGKDPQKKAVKLGHETAGCVIHRVTSELDSGEIVVSKEINIKGLSEDLVIAKLHKLGTECWIEFINSL